MPEAKHQSLDQRRAVHAWDAIQRAKKLEDSQRNDFGRTAKKLPAQIVTTGLGQALAFVVAKARADLLERAMRNWIVDQRRIYEGSGDLVKCVIDGTSEQLRRATEEAMIYLQWLNRFAEAENIPDKNKQA